MPVPGLKVTSNTCPGVAGVLALNPLYEIHAWFPLSGSTKIELTWRFGVTASSSMRVQLTADAGTASTLVDTNTRPVFVAAQLVMTYQTPAQPVTVSSPLAGQWYVGQGAGCKDSRLLPIEANGCVGFGAYKVDPEGGHAPFAIQVIEVSPDGWITGLHHFLDPDLFPAFGLPTHLPAE